MSTGAIQANAGAIKQASSITELPDFGWAIRKLKAGFMVTRRGWNGQGQFLTLQKPDEHSKMTLPYIFITTVQGELVPWLSSQTDMLSEDWMIV
jgi:hypothetical protein